jgi:GntR family transcriptional regulator, trigonelline degradation regulator
MTPVPADRLQARLLREQVAGMLRQAIIDMRLKPGERLVERELVESTGVSRATVREAIRQLAAEGLVTAVPLRGAVVAEPTRKEAEELYEVRATLEGLAGRLFARRASDAERLRLRQAFEELGLAVGGGAGTWAMLSAKNRFYEVLLQGADNGTMRAVLEPLQARITVLRATTMSRQGRGPAALGEIRAIVEAVEARDEEAAYRACVHHVEQAARLALEALARPAGAAADEAADQRPARSAHEE